jgi:hypothetical protein
MTFHYNEPLLRRAVLCFWWRTIGPGFLIFLMLAAGFVAWLVSRGDTSWVVGALATALAFAVIMMAVLYVVHYRNTLGKFKAMGNPEVTFKACESSFSVVSALGSSMLQWSSVTEIWRFPSFWLLFFSKAQFITLPLADIAPEAQAFILERVQDSGGKIR